MRGPTPSVMPYNKQSSAPVVAEGFATKVHLQGGDHRLQGKYTDTVCSTDTYVAMLEIVI